MKHVISLLLTLAISLSPAVALAQEHDHSGHAMPYAGLESRAIKSLSEADIEELRRGGGWGLALAAELNGMPGPAHLLELKDEIPLTHDQVTAIEKIFQQMKADAIAAGEKLISAEQALEDAFRSGKLEKDTLRQLISDAEAARAELRYIHLSRHLETPALLTSEQIARYKTLRGYQGDPCANVPEGHDPAMWKLHNGCK
jgi:Spy/CpxP family protein refolding chaperone